MSSESVFLSWLLFIYHNTISVIPIIIHYLPNLDTFYESCWVSTKVQKHSTPVNNIVDINHTGRIKSYIGTYKSIRKSSISGRDFTVTPAPYFKFPITKSSQYIRCRYHFARTCKGYNISPHANLYHSFTLSEIMCRPACYEKNGATFGVFRQKDAIFR
jgi:hypothetical protein